MATKLFEVGAPDVVYLVDLSSYLLRAYHAVAPLSSPSGEPTHAVHGTVTMLDRLFRERRPQMVAIAMDAGRDTFRKELYPEYKANRPPSPDDLRVQIRRSEEIVRASGLAVFKQSGVEADDLIASIVKGSRAAGHRVVIVSADKDLMQLVGDGVIMWDTLRNKVFGPPEVEERFKVPATLLGDLLALMGDSSDNIPGVPSVGPKTAATLLQDYGSLDGIYQNLENIKRKKLKETLTDNEDKARLSRRLVALKDDCEVDTSSDALAFAPASRREDDRLCDLFSELGFTRQLTAMKSGTAAIQQGGSTSSSNAGDEGSSKESAPDEAPPTPDSPLLPTHIVNTPEHLTDLIEHLAQGPWALELYTVRPDHHRGPVLGAALSSQEAQYYLPFAHRIVGAPPQLDAKETLTALLAALSSGSAALSVHDLKRCLVMLHEAEIDGALREPHDAMLGSYLLDPERGHDVVSLGAAVQLHVPEYDKFSKEGRQKRTWDELEVAQAAELAALRVAAIRRASDLQKVKLVDDGLLDLLQNVELPLARKLAELEELGVLVDTECLARLGEITKTELASLEKQAYEVVGKEFNVNSPKQLATILFDELGLKPIKRTKTARSTDAQTLEALSDEHELPALILKIRQIAKLQGTYIEALPALVSKKTGRIHGAWEQAVAATGRLSSTEPNLQNIPIRSELGRKIRDAFVAPEGYEIVSADYSQIELRVLAHLSQDERLVEAFQTGQDVHTRTAMEIFEVNEDELTRELRSRAKAVNFGVIYGQGDSALAKSLGIPKQEAARFIAAYFRRYDGVRTFMESTLDQAREGNAVHSLLGRRRTVPDIKSGHRGRRLAAERIAMNMPIQGSAADILKLAMLKLAKPVTPGSRMVLTVHDELVFEVPNSEVAEAIPGIKSAMESAYELTVPLVVEVGHGNNWNSAH